MREVERERGREKEGEREGEHESEREREGGNLTWIYIVRLRVQGGIQCRSTRRPGDARQCLSPPLLSEAPAVKRCYCQVFVASKITTNIYSDYYQHHYYENGRHACCFRVWGVRAVSVDS